MDVSGWPLSSDYLGIPVQSLADSSANVESTYQGRRVSQSLEDSPSLKAENPGLCSRAWSEIKSISRNVSIFCRAVWKVTLIGYFYLKHRLLRCNFTSQNLQNYLQRLGSAYPKLLQMLIANPGLVKQLAADFKINESDYPEYYAVIRNVLDNNPEIPATVARSILDKAGYKDHSVERHIATGTIGSCFEVKKDEESYLVKVVPDWKAIDLVAGLKSIRMLMLFLPKTMITAFRELTDPFIAECQLNEEKKNQTVFKEALEKTFKEVPLELPFLNEKKLTFKVPEITETSDTDNLLIMEYLHDAHTLNALANPANKQLRSDIFHNYYSDFPFSYDDFYGMALLGKVHGLVKTKWRELALKHGIVHGDCHPGNIMLRFKPGGHIDVWFIDFGNCIMLTEAQMALYPETVGLLSKLANPYLPEAVNQARVDRLVDIIWDEMAISIEDNTPDNKETFKNKALNSFIALRDYETTINESSMSPKDKADFINGFNDPSKKELIRGLFFYFASTTMSSICKGEGIELPSSFTRYNAAHFRADIDLA